MVTKFSEKMKLFCAAASDPQAGLSASFERANNSATAPVDIPAGKPSIFRDRGFGC